MGRRAAISRVLGAFLMVGLTALFILFDAKEIAESQLSKNFLDGFSWHWGALFTLFVASIIVSQTWYQLHRQATAPLPTETLEHHQKLKTMLNRIQEATTLEDRALEMASWVVSEQKRLAIHGGEVLMSSDGSLTVNIESEDTSDWKYLRQHTKKDPIWQALKEYKEAVTQDIATRRSLFLSVQAGTARETGLPIKKKDTPIGAEYIDQLVLEMIYGRVFFKAIGKESPRQTNLTNYDVEEEKVWLGPHRSAIAAVSYNPDTRAIVMRIASAFHEIDERFFNENPDIRSHYENREIAARRLDGERRRLQLAPHLPRSGKCDACRDLS